MKNIILKLFQIKKEKIYYMNKDDMMGIKAKVDCNILLVNEHNYKRVLEMRDNAVSKSFYNMLKNNEIGLLAEVDNNIVSHAWLQLSLYNEKNYNDSFGRLKGNEAIIHFCNTDPKYRGNNIYPFLIYNLASMYFKKSPNGVLYITTSPNNISSQKGILKVGFKYLEDRIIFKIFKYIKFTISINTS